MDKFNIFIILIMSLAVMNMFIAASLNLNHYTNFWCIDKDMQDYFDKEYLKYAESNGNEYIFLRDMAIYPSEKPCEK